MDKNYYNKIKKELRIINYLSLIPFIGYFIVLFSCAFKIKQHKQSYFYTLWFMFLSLMILALWALIFSPLVGYYMAHKSNNAVMIWLLVGGYFLYLCSGLCVCALCRMFFVKFQKEDDE